MSSVAATRARATIYTLVKRRGATTAVSAASSAAVMGETSSLEGGGRLAVRTMSSLFVRREDRMMSIFPKNNVVDLGGVYSDASFPGRRCFGTTTDGDKDKKTEEEEEEQGEGTTKSDASSSSSSSDDSSSDEEESAGGGEEDEDDGATTVQPTTPMTKEEELELEIKNLKDQLLRSLAEAENTRRIAKRDVESARNYALSSFAKSLLDTSDNLTRAMEAVPEELLTDAERNPQLVSLYEGIQMTADNFDKALAKHGLTKFGKEGEMFDPNQHNALYEYPDEGKESGTLGQVIKIGFMLNGRVLRPAEVGVVKK